MVIELTHLLELLDRTLINTTALIDKMAYRWKNTISR